MNRLRSSSLDHKTLNTMKNLALILTTSLLLSCSKEPQPTTPRHVTLVLDISNQHLTQGLAGDLDAITKTLGLNDDPWRAVRFRLVTVGALGYDRVEETTLEYEDPDDSNIIVRRNRIKAFEERVKQLIRSRLAGYREAEASLLYVPTTMELELLAACGTCSRELILVSDGIEHHGTDRFSMYSDSTMNGIMATPEEYERLFDAQRRMPDLTGITITVVATPLNTANSVRVQRVYAFWEHLWKKNGASVTFTSNYH